MPDISIVNETPNMLRIALVAGPSPASFDNHIAGGQTFYSHVPSVRLHVSLFPVDELRNSSYRTDVLLV